MVRPFETVPPTLLMNCLSRYLPSFRHFFFVPLWLVLLPSAFAVTNDHFAERLVLPGEASVSTTGTTVGATKEAGEPNHAGASGGASVWWSWTAPASASVTIQTFGSSFDTLLAVYTGSAVDALTLVSSNDDALGTLQSEVTFVATAGVTYQIAVDGWGAGTGSVSLTILPTPPPIVYASTSAMAETEEAVVIRGLYFSSTPENNTVTFSPAQSNPVAIYFASPTTLVVTGLSDLTLGALNAVVTTNGVSSGPPTQVATVNVPGPGDLDWFNADVVGGILRTTVVQPDGKTIIAGNFSSILGVARNNIARLNADGTVDMGFNPDVNDEVRTVAVQADGRILLGGRFTSVDGMERNRVARVAEDGTLEEDFNPDVNSWVNCIVVQADGRILLGGRFVALGGMPQSRIARLAADGTVDVNFAPDPNNEVFSVVERDGQIIMGGTFTSVAGTERNRIARVAATGVLDAGFNPNADDIVRCLAVQADGKILVGGQFSSMGGLARSRMARLAADGTVDIGFNPNVNSWVTSMAVQADGQILIAGSFTSVGGLGRNRFALLTAGGLPVAGFSANADAEITGTSLQADGGILLTGSFTTIRRTPRRFMGRLLNHPATQTLSPVDESQVRWNRGGSAPDVSQTTFELSTDEGATFTPLTGTVTRVNGTADWRITGLSLPMSGQLRARGRTAGGFWNGGSGMVEQVVSFTLAPDIAVEQASPLTDGTSQVGFSALLGESSEAKTFTITNPGSDDLTGLVVTPSGPDAADFTVSELSATSVAPSAGAATFTVTFTPRSGGVKSASLHIASNVTGEKNPFDIGLTGVGSNAVQAAQTIVFNAPPKLHLAETPVLMSGSASSGLPVTFSLVSGPAMMIGNQLFLNGVGVVKVRASQAGNASFLAATSVERTIAVVASPSALTLSNLHQTYTGTPRPITVLGAEGAVDVTYRVGNAFVPTAPIHAGSYRVRAVAGASTVTGTLVITKAPLFVQPYDQRKFAGGVNPVLTYRYSGFLGSDNAANSVARAPTIRTTARTNSVRGLYPITVRGGTSANYVFVYQNGVMQVESFVFKYEALLVDAETTRPVSKLELTVARSGRSFTGKLTTATEKSAVGFRGLLATNLLAETASGTVMVRRGDNTYLVTMTLPLTGDISTEVKLNGVTLGTATNGRKLRTLARGETLSYRGAHSALLAPALPANLGVPAGAGWAVATINAKGTLRLAGGLADGRKYTSSLAADLSDDPGYRLFMQPYRPTRTGAFMAGAFALKPHPDLAGRRFVAFDDAADMTWAKAPRQLDTSYRAGFGPVDARLTLDPWLPPVAAKKNVTAISLAQRLGLTGPENQFTAKYSAIDSPSFANLPTLVALIGPTPRVRVVAPVMAPAISTKWKIAIKPKTGAFAGSFEMIDAGKRRKVPFSGILRQPPSTDTSGLIGNGHFQLRSLSPAPNNEVLSGELGFER